MIRAGRLSFLRLRKVLKAGSNRTRLQELSSFLRTREALTLTIGGRR
jgi:hypothetical protein